MFICIELIFVEQQTDLIYFIFFWSLTCKMFMCFLFYMLLSMKCLLLIHHDNPVSRINNYKHILFVIERLQTLLVQQSSKHHCFVKVLIHFQLCMKLASYKWMWMKCEMDILWIISLLEKGSWTVEVFTKLLAKKFVLANLPGHLNI